MAVEISVIVPARGNGGMLDACLKSLLSQNTPYSYEVLVAFCAEDRDVEDVLSRHTRVQAVRSADYMLPGAARNLGAQNARAEILVFIDSDCIVDSGWLGHAIETIRAGAVLCGGAILDLRPWNMIAASDNRLQYVDFSARRPAGPADYFPGANIAVTKDVFEQNDGFGKAIYAQDVLFTTQLAKLFPRQCMFSPQMIVRHYGRNGWPEFLEHQKAFGYDRALNDLLVNDSLRWLAQRRWLAWVVLLRRLTYITLRVVQWNLPDLPRYILQLPFIFAGLISWTAGFYQGYAERINLKEEEPK